MSNDRKTEDYEVGYGKPPESGQFKKGVSGNPSGRPKKASDFEAKLLRELNSPLVITEHGKRKVITKDEGIVKQVVNKALTAHVPTLRLLDNLRRQALEKDAEQRRLANRTIDELTDEELTAIIRGQYPYPVLRKATPDGADGQ
jgi:hypothetical protein